MGKKRGRSKSHRKPLAKQRRTRQRRNRRTRARAIVTISSSLDAESVEVLRQVRESLRHVLNQEA
jgi:hypothetical protein